MAHSSFPTAFQSAAESAIIRLVRMGRTTLSTEPKATIIAEPRR